MDVRCLAAALLAMLALPACSTTVGGLNTQFETCAGVRCARGESCCRSTFRCFDPATNPGACPRPSPPGGTGDASGLGVDAAVGDSGGVPGPTPSGLSGAPCAANAHCRADEYCQPLLAPCSGVGECRPRTCAASTSAGGLCACDGVSYPDTRSACAAGTPVIGGGACGVTMQLFNGAPPGTPSSLIASVTLCGMDSQCPSGQRCCGLSGTCFDPARWPNYCDSFPPPPMPCTGTGATQCYYGNYCAHAGCAGSGTCVPVDHSLTCPPIIAPVCGCDGHTYQSACYATQSGVNVAAQGTCP